MIVDLIEFLKARPLTVKYCCYGLLVAIILWSMIAVDTHHAHSWLEKIPGFWSAFGFIAAGIVVFVARWLAKSGIETREDYYDK